MPNAEVDNSLRDRHYPSQHTKAEFNNCLIFHPNIFIPNKHTSSWTFFKTVLFFGSVASKTDFFLEDTPYSKK